MWKKVVPVAAALSLAVTPAAFAADDMTDAAAAQFRLRPMLESRQVFSQVIAAAADPAAAQDWALHWHQQLLDRAQQILDNQEDLADRLLAGAGELQNVAVARMGTVSAKGIQARTDDLTEWAERVLEQAPQIKEQIAAGEGMQALLSLLPSVPGKLGRAIPALGAEVKIHMRFDDNTAIEVDAETTQEQLLQMVDRLVAKAEQILDGEPDLAARLTDAVECDAMMDSDAEHPLAWMKMGMTELSKADIEVTEENVQETVEQLVTWAQGVVDNADQVRARIEAGEIAAVIDELRQQMPGLHGVAFPALEIRRKLSHDFVHPEQAVELTEQTESVDVTN